MNPYPGQVAGILLPKNMTDATIAHLQARISLDLHQFQAGMQRVHHDLAGVATGAGRAEGPVGGLVSGLGRIGLAAAGIGAIAQGVAAAGRALGSFTAAAMDAQAVMAQTQAVIRSTGGAAGFTADQIADLSRSLSAATGWSTFGDEAVQAGANVLATFTQIKGPQFDGAMRAILDMSTALGTDLQGAAIQVGKALNDPVRGVSALQRVGVSFTQAQKDVIKHLVETGQAAKAQQLILAELRTEFGGSAQAAAGTLAGQLAILRERFGDVQETVGAALLPVLSQVVGFLAGPVMTGLQSLAANVAAGIGQVTPVLHGLASAAQVVSAHVGGLGGVIQTLLEPLHLLGQTAQAAFAGFQTGGLQGALTALGTAIPQIIGQFAQGRIDLANTLVGWGQALVDWLVPVVPQVLLGLGQFGLAVVDGLLAVLPLLTDALLALGQRLVDWIVLAIPLVVAQLAVWGQAIWNELLALLPRVSATLLQIAGKFVDWIVPLIPQVVAQLQQWGSAVFAWLLNTAIPQLAQAVVQMGQQLVEWVVPRIPMLLQALGQLLASTIAFFATNLGLLAAKLAEWGTALVAWIAPRIGPALEQLAVWAGAAGQWLLNTGLPVLRRMLLQWGVALIAWIAPRIGELIIQLAQWAGAAIVWLSQTGLPLLKAQLVNWAKALILWIIDAAPQVLAQLQAFRQAILSFAEQALPMIVRGFQNWGIELVNGIIGGINERVGPLLTGLANMLNPAIDALNNTLGSDIARLGTQFDRIPIVAGPGFKGLLNLTLTTFDRLPDLTFPSLEALLAGTQERLDRLPRNSREALAEFGDTVATAAQPGLDALLAELLAAFDKGAAAATAAIPAFADGAGAAGDALAAGIAGGKGGQGGTKGAAAQTAADMAALVQTVVQGLGQAAQAASAGGQGVSAALLALWEVLDEATKAKMGSVAQTITTYLTQAKNGALPTAEALRAGVVAQLEALARSGDQQTRLLAQSILDSLTKAETGAVQKAESLSEKLGAAFLKAQQGAVQTMGKLVTDLSAPGANFADALDGLLTLADQAVAAKMPGLAGQITTWVQQAASGVGVSAAAIRDDLLARLQELAASTDPIIAAWAQKFIAQLDTMKQAAAEKGLQIQQSLVQAIGQAALGTAQGGQNIYTNLLQYLELAKVAADANMGDVAGRITHWIQEAAAGSSTAWGMLQAETGLLLDQMAQSTDLKTRLLAEQIKANLETARAGAAEKMLGLQQAIVGPLGQLATQVAQGVSNLPQVITQVLALSDQAATAGMGTLSTNLANLGLLLQQGSSAAFQNLLPTIRGYLEELLATADEKTRLAVQAILANLDTLTAQATVKMQEMAAQAEQGVVQGLGRAAAAAAGGSQSVYDVIVGLMPLLRQATDAGMEDVAASIQKWLDAAAAGTPPPMAEIYDSIVKMLVAAAADGDAATQLLAQQALANLDKLKEGAAAKSAATSTAICGEVKKAADCTTETLDEAARQGTEALEQLAREGSAAIARMGGEVTTGTDRMVEQMVGAFEGADLSAAASALIDGFVAEIDRRQGDVEAAIQQLVDAVNGVTTAGFGIASPSQVFAGIARQNAAGYVQGWEQALPGVQRALRSSLPALTPPPLPMLPLMPEPAWLEVGAGGGAAARGGLGGGTVIQNPIYIDGLSIGDAPPAVSAWLQGMARRKHVHNRGVRLGG